MLFTFYLRDQRIWYTMSQLSRNCGYDMAAIHLASCRVHHVHWNCCELLLSLYNFENGEISCASASEEPSSNFNNSDVLLSLNNCLALPVVSSRGSLAGMPRDRSKKCQFGSGWFVAYIKASMSLNYEKNELKDGLVHDVYHGGHWDFADIASDPDLFSRARLV